MTALALAMCLAAAGDTDLPRSLSADESRYTIAPPLAKEDLSFWAGVHLGVAGAYDADDPAFLLGANGRAHILPWLGADVSIDFQLKQSFESRQIHTFQVPLEVCGLFYPPLDWPVRPYGMFGVGFTITSIDYSGALGRADTTDLNVLFFLGFGAEFELAPNLLLDANLRFVFVTDPPHFAGNSADWIQFTVGIMLKLSK